MDKSEESYRKKFPKGKDWKDPKPNPFGHCGLNPDSYHGMEIVAVSIEKYEELEEKCKKLEEYLSHDFFPRFGGGIGVTRMVRAMEMSGLMK